MSINFDFSNKNVLVTGANGDIGSEITSKFLEAGANCICLDKNFKYLKKIAISKKYRKKIFF